jgi:cyclophilin family peptidyl-prolyl cis-trans isomerase/protein-disulfide isomerase
VEAKKIEMRKTLVILVVFLAIILAACGNQPASLEEMVGAEQAGVDPTLETVSETEISEEPVIQPTVTLVPSAPATCTAVSSGMVKFDQEDIPYRSITEDDWILGDAENPIVTFVVYTDFECPHCAQLDPVLTQLVADYSQSVQLVFRHFPLTQHVKAWLAARASNSAGRQGDDMFFAMHDIIFEGHRSGEWSNMTVEDFADWLVEKARELGLDENQFSADLQDGSEIAKRVEDSKQEGVNIGIKSTPSLYINGAPYGGPTDYTNLKNIVELHILESRQFSECPSEVIDPQKDYLAVLNTEKGEIRIELFAAEAPVTVNSFAFLAQSGWFDGVMFHRVLPGFIAQAGDPSGTGYGAPGYTFSNEIDPGLRFDQPGRVGMANTGPDSNGSQFFIAYDALPNLDGAYTVFGQVVSGMDVLQELAPRDPAGSSNMLEYDPVRGYILPDGDRILLVTIEER